MLWGWVDHLSAIVFRASLPAALLSSLVMLAMLGCRQPARRIALARAALFGALVLIPLVGLAPLPRFEVFAALRGVGVLPHPLLGPERAPSPAGDLALPGNRGPGTARVMFALYLAGVGACLAELVVGYWGLGWLRRHSSTPSPGAQAIYDAIPLSGRRARPRLRVTTRVRRPVLLGTYRPTILIPPALDVEAPDADASEALRLSLLHELAHADRLDPWFSLLGSLARAFWFFLPPLWWIRAQMRLDHEFLADRRASLGFGAPETYASALVAMAAPRPPPTASVMEPLPLAPSPVASAGSPLFQRIRMLVSCPFRIEHCPPAWWRRSLPILIVVITPLTACLCLDFGAGGLPASTVTPQSQTFRVARLTIAPRSPGPQGRVPVFELPLRLPEQFHLVLEVWGDAAALALSRVVGQRLGSPEAAGAPEPETWHHVQVQRGPRGLTLSVDDRPVPHDPAIDRITPRLAVEPAPGRPARYRNLCITW